MMGYYSVFNPRGEKIADCGIERDAVNPVSYTHLTLPTNREV